MASLRMGTHVFSKTRSSRKPNFQPQSVLPPIASEFYLANDNLLGAIKLSREQHHKKSFVLKIDCTECQFLIETENQVSFFDWRT